MSGSVAPGPGIGVAEQGLPELCFLWNTGACSFLIQVPSLCRPWPTETKTADFGLVAAGRTSGVRTFKSYCPLLKG